MLEFGPRGPVTDYNAKMEDIRDNMKSILEKVTEHYRIVTAEEKQPYSI